MVNLIGDNFTIISYESMLALSLYDSRVVIYDYGAFIRMSNGLKLLEWSFVAMMSAP